MNGMKFKIGDRVVVTDAGKDYPICPEMARALGLTNYRSPFSAELRCKITHAIIREGRDDIYVVDATGINEQYIVGEFGLALCRDNEKFKADRDSLQGIVTDLKNIAQEKDAEAIEFATALAKARAERDEFKSKNHTLMSNVLGLNDEVAEHKRRALLADEPEERSCTNCEHLGDEHGCKRNGKCLIMMNPCGIWSPANLEPATFWAVRYGSKYHNDTMYQYHEEACDDCVKIVHAQVCRDAKVVEFREVTKQNRRDFSARTKGRNNDTDN